MKKIIVGVALASLQAGCAMESAENSPLEHVGSKEQESVVVHTRIYSYNAGSWRRTTFLNGAISGGTTVAYSFGDPDDTPILGYDRWGGAWIGTYGEYADTSRRGYFYFDTNQSGGWEGSDYFVRFLPYNQVQSGDKPFVVYAQLWHRNGSGACVPRVDESGGLTFPIFGQMVGIQRGLTAYLDRDGDGIYQATGNHCDITTTGQFAASGDIPIGGASYGTARIVGGSLHWFFDANNNLTWNQPPDTSSTNFGSSTMLVPPSHPQGTSVYSGRTVYWDYDLNRVWSSGDKTYVNVLPSTSWKLVGVAQYEEVN